MPCNAAPSPEFSSEDLDAVEIYMQTQVDRVTRIACEAIKVLRLNALFCELSEESKAWSLEHDAWDVARALIEKTAEVTVRKPHFDKDGNALYHGPCDDDIDDLRRQRVYLGGPKTADADLARSVYESIVEENEEYVNDDDDTIQDTDAGVNTRNSPLRRTGEGEGPSAS